MPKQGWAILTCFLLLGVGGPSEAAPPDPPNAEHADGLPCNSLCRYYLAWSHRLSSYFAQPAPPDPVQLPPETEIPRPAGTFVDRTKPATRAPGAPNSAEMTHAKIAGSRPAASTTAPAGSASAGSPPKAHPRKTDALAAATGGGSKPEAPVVAAKHGTANAVDAPRGDTAASRPAANGAADPARSHPADPAPKAGAPLDPGTGTTAANDGAATPAAEPGTATTSVAASDPKANHVDGSNQSESLAPASQEKEKVATGPSNEMDGMVVLVLTRPDIKSVSDLAHQSVAMDDQQSASRDSVRIAIAAAGATEVQLSEGRTKAINRLINGEAPAAVLALMPADTAKEFTDIAGFNLFRIPLSPGLPKAPL